MLHISLGGGGTFFFFLRRVRRSQQLPAAIPRRRKLSPRRGKKADVSAQSQGQMDSWRCGVCGNRIYLAAAIRSAYARSHVRNFVSGRRRCQLSFKEALHGLAEWARHARTEPGEAAQLWYRGTVGPIARVYGPGGASVRPRRRVATRVSIVSGIEKKDDLPRLFWFSVGA